MGDGPAPSREVAETQPPSVAPGPSTKSGAAAGRSTAESPLASAVSGTSLDANGKLVWRGSVRSSGMTPAEKALGFPHSMNAAHTEARLVRTAVLPRGGTFTIIGQYDPCIACQIEMRAAAARSGCTIEYWWPGATKGAFVAAPPASTSLTPVTLRAGAALAPPRALPAATAPPKAGPQQLELPLGMKPAPIPRGVTPAGAVTPAGGGPALRPVVPSVPPAQLELLVPRAPIPRGDAAAVRGGWGPAIADFAVFLIGNAVMEYVRAEIAAKEQAMFDATRPEIEARAAALTDQVRVRQASLGGETLWVNVLLAPTYQRIEDSKPGEEGEWTSLISVRIDAVTLGEAYRSGYTQGEPKLINTNGAWVNLYERHDLLEFSFPCPYDPSAMTRDEIVRRIVETEREARRRSVLPQGVRDALAEERAALLQARDALTPPAGVEFAP